MDEQSVCPVCNSPVAAGSHQCSRCGFKLVGGTEEIHMPVLEPTAHGMQPVAGKPRLVVTKGADAGLEFMLDALPAVIGREPECDIFLNNMTVSRKHAVIERHGNRIVLKDAGSLNGTWVNGKVVEEADLTEGSVVQIGTFAMRYTEGRD
jgi:hypothetical protein